MHTVSNSPPRAPPIKYTAPLGTRWDKEKAAAGGAAAFDLPTDPKNIGPWILGECIGKGASGRVKLAKHRRTGQLAAVKILPIAPLVSSRASLATQQAKSDKQRLGIDREITMMKLMNHPNIMRIYDVYEGDKELFLVLEYVEGGELFDFLVNKGRLPPNEALIYFRQIVYGLNYAHTFSIIHRDLKPENILIASLAPPVVKIADWGMAAFAPPSLQLETSCGSPHYASPEIVNGEKYQGNATDIWSCGVILYALLTGRLPFDDKNVRTLLSKVKTGKYEMPNWIDPLARDLLARMLIVDVNQRITIPEILSHPWLLSQASATYAASDGTTYTLTPPPLPPSPSTLARPLVSSSIIDSDLLSSLRIIWGRHTDPLGESIKRDLCSPSGHGVHAKAFYFLLGKYREESTRNRSNDMELDKQLNLPDSDIDLETTKFNLCWELDHSGVTKKHDAQKQHPVGPLPHVTASAPVSAATPSSPPSISASAAVPNVRKRTFTDSTLPSSSKTESTVGHRHPPGVNVQRGDHFKHSLETKADSSTDPPLKGGRRPDSSLGIGRGGPRPVPPRRGYINTSAIEEEKEKVGGSSTSSSRDPRGQFSPNPAHRPRTSAASKPLSDVEKKAAFVINSPRVSSGSGAPQVEVELDLPLLTAPQIDDPRLQQTVNNLTQRVNDLVQSITQPQKPIADANNDTTTTAPVKTTFVPAAEVDKENQSIDEESWSHVSAEVGRPRALGLGVEIVGGRDIGKDVGNAPPVSSPPRSRKENVKERKARPPPLDLPVLRPRRSTFTVLGSPISLATPIHQPLNSARLITSPVVGEFKGWFSNLFNWKNSNGQGGLLYSSDDVQRTRTQVARILDGLGITLSHPLEHQPDQPEILFCRIDQPFTDPASGISLKNVRFRVEMRAGPSPSEHPSLTPSGDETSYLLSAPLYAPHPVSTPTSASGSRPRGSVLMGRSFTHGTTPLPSPAVLSKWEFPPGCLCAIALVHEKGSMSTFRAVWRRLKEEYGDGSTAYPCFSPALPNTPYTPYTGDQQQQRMLG